jgi:chaperone required for assembly of F1-ATPase
VIWLQTLAFTLIVAQFVLLLAFARNRRMWQVMASNALLLLAVLTLSVVVLDMDYQRDQWGVAIDALTRLRDRMATACQ